MSYNVRCYYNTGFNAVNIPDSPSLLNNMTYEDLEAVDILQDWGLSSVRVRIGTMSIQNCDYCRVGNEYYSVGTPVMVAPDVAELPLIYDGVTSAGGPSSLSYLDGITERHTVSDDTMFKYTQEDELTAPREALQLVSGGMLFRKSTAGDLGGTTVVESTIDLYELGKEITQGSLESQTYTDSDGANSVTVPSVPYITSHTGFSLKSSGDDNIGATYSPATQLFTSEGAKQAIATCRALGIESGIVSQVQYLEPFTTVTTSSTQDGVVVQVAGNNVTVSSGLPFKYASPKNNRVLYGNHNQYGIISASGGKGEYLPEQIDDGNTSPNIKAISDPRPDGRPYFRFASYMGDSSDENFFNSAVAGLEWKQVPLVFTDPSNSMLNTANFTNKATLDEANYTAQQSTLALNRGRAGVGQVIGGISAGANIAGNLASGNIAGALSAGAGFLQNTYNNAMQMRQYDIDAVQQADAYRLSREKELQNFGYSQSVVVPTVMFPFNTNTIRDFIGNGVFVYRYRYSANDITRIDKLLTMYGYKDTVALTADLFNQRTYFDYVRASGVSIGGSIPKWKKAIITEQLNAGIRVWHVAPSASYYSNNPVAGSEE